MRWERLPADKIAACLVIVCSPISSGIQLVTKRLFVLVFIFLWSCSTETARSVEVYFKTTSGNITPKIHAELALSASERALGLMYRREMANNRGMFFIFPREQMQRFWMKNTYLELDMIFIDAGHKVVSVVHKAVPLSESHRASKLPAKYVLEVNGGLAEKWGLGKGAQLIVNEELPSVID